MTRVVNCVMIAHREVGNISEPVGNVSCDPDMNCQESHSIGAELESKKARMYISFI